MLPWFFSNVQVVISMGHSVPQQMRWFWYCVQLLNTETIRQNLSPVREQSNFTAVTIRQVTWSKIFTTQLTGTPSWIYGTKNYMETTKKPNDSWGSRQPVNKTTAGKHVTIKITVIQSSKFQEDVAFWPAINKDWNVIHFPHVFM